MPIPSDDMIARCKRIDPSFYEVTRQNAKARASAFNGYSLPSRIFYFREFLKDLSPDTRKLLKELCEEAIA